jgi:hypothetical protein
MPDTEAPPFDDRPASKPGVTGVFTRKLGPLPFWAWGAIGVGVIYLYMRYRASQTAASATTAASTAAIGPGTVSPVGTTLGYTGSLGDQIQALQNTLASQAATSAAAPAPGSNWQGSSLVPDLTAAYQADLGRPADAGGLNYWTSQVQAGKITEQQALDAIAQSQDAQLYAQSGFKTGYSGGKPYVAPSTAAAVAPLQPNIAK